VRVYQGKLDRRNGHRGNNLNEWWKSRSAAPFLSMLDVIKLRDLFLFLAHDAGHTRNHQNIDFMKETEIQTEGW
jgi:hypothetical protein